MTPKTATYRQLRIFISSTFNDMRGERNVLMEKVIPMVSEYCHKRKAEFIGVDLRWGVSEEQSKRGETVSICMNEIDRCRPLFLGMLGERYGYIPAGAVISLTEQEMRYGALEAPDGTEAFFYLRDPALTEELCGPFPADERQDDLKRRIRESAFPVMDGYRDLDSFGSRVYEDLIGAVDRMLDHVEETDPVTSMRAEQIFLAERHAAHYVDRPGELAKLTDCVAEGGLILLTGEAGVGKTAMLAKWALGQIASEEAYTFLFFVGSAADKGWEQLARQLVSELCRHFSLEEQECSDPESLRREVCRVLHMAARKGRVILALDQMDALSLDDAFGMSWLPEELPESVSVIASLDEGDALSRLRRRRHRERQLRLLTHEEVGTVAERYLAAHSKTLSVRQTAMLTESEHARNPLYLITLLNEIRHIGRHSKLTEQMEEYLRCDSLTELFDRVLAHIDSDYDEENTALPRRFLTLLEASRGGLTEGELISLLGDIPYARFMPVRLSLEPFTAVSGGAIHVAIPAFRTALRKHYGLQEQELSDCRRTLMLWFGEHTDTPRRSYVLPWLYRETGEYGKLYDFLSREECFYELWRRNSYEVKEYWSELRAKGASAADAYRGVLDNPERGDSGMIVALAEFLADTGEISGARELLQKLTEQVSEGDAAQRCAAFGLLGNLYQREGKFREAEDCYLQKSRIAEALGDSYEQERAQGNLGLIAMKRGDYPAARRAFEQTLELAVGMNQRDAQQIALGNLGNLAFVTGDPDQAEALYTRQKTISMDSGNPAGIINACGALGVIFSRKKQYEAAEAEFAEQERQSRRIGAADGLSNALGNRAILARLRGEADRAEALLEEKLELCRQSGQLAGEQNALGNLAQLAAERGDVQTALTYARQRAEVTLRGRAFRQYAEALLQLSELEEANGREDDAAKHRLEAYSIAGQQGFPLPKQRR